MGSWSRCLLYWLYGSFRTLTWSWIICFKIRVLWTLIFLLHSDLNISPRFSGLNENLFCSTIAHCHTQIDAEETIMDFQIPQKFSRSQTVSSLVLIVDGSSEIGAHVSVICFLGIYSVRVTIWYKYQGIKERHSKCTIVKKQRNLIPFKYVTYIFQMILNLYFYF